MPRQRSPSSPVDVAGDGPVREAVPAGPAARRQPDARADPPHPLGRGRPEAEAGQRLVRLQVYALETLLLPEKGEERDKLLLTQGVQEADAGGVPGADDQAARDARARSWPRRPRLTAAAAQLDRSSRGCGVEPCPSYYLRTARAYAFLANFLEAALGKDGAAGAARLKQGGQRDAGPARRAAVQRDLFYGLYLVSAEDIGLKPAFLAGRAGRSGAVLPAGRRVAAEGVRRRGPGRRHPRGGADLRGPGPRGARGCGRRSACGWRSWSELRPAAAR